MGFFGNIKNAAVKAKINAEIKLIDRELANRKRAFGVELFDLVETNDDKAASYLPSFFKAAATQIEGPMNSCRLDIRDFERERKLHTSELDRIENKRERSGRANSAGETASKAGEWISDAGTSSKLEVKIALLDRKIKQRKEDFGLEVYDMIAEATNRAATAPAPKKQQSIKGMLKVVGKTAKKTLEKGVETVKSGVTDNLSKFNQSEQEIHKCVDNAKDDIRIILSRRQTKEREIALLENENS